MSQIYKDLNPSPRLLLGPGPSMVHPRVLRSMATPLVGHLDPDFLDILSEVKGLLQFVFQTQNELTLAVPGTGTSGMERCLCWTASQLPGDLDDSGLRPRLLEEYNIEIAGGFGPLEGKIWRIGLMGHSSRKENVRLLLAALGDLLNV